MAQVGFKLAQVGLKLAQDGLMVPQVGPSWPQVGSSWFQVGSKLAQIGPKVSSGSLQEALLEGPGRVKAGSWEALGAKRPSWRPPEVPKWHPGDSKIDEKSIKLISDLRALASE